MILGREIERTCADKMQSRYTFLTGIFQRYRENFSPLGGFKSALVAMRYIKGMTVPAFWKSSPLCHRKGALLMSEGSKPADQYNIMDAHHSETNHTAPVCPQASYRFTMYR